jgi:hypothetical protein
MEVYFLLKFLKYLLTIIELNLYPYEYLGDRAKNKKPFNCSTVLGST